MAGNRAGGLKSAATVRLKYGNDFYRCIGAIGGRNGHTGGFYADPMLAKIVGQKGGRTSRRGNAEESAIKRETREREKAELWERAQRFIKGEANDGDL